MRCRLSVALLTIFWFASTPSAAADVAKTLEAFHRACLVQGPNFDATASLAAVEGWQPVPEDNFAGLLLLQKPQSVSGWLASDRTIPETIVVGVTRARLHGRPVETCTVAFTSVPIEAFLEAFFDRTDAEKLSEEQQGTWTSSLYILVAGDRKQFVKFKYAVSPDRSGPIAASSIAER